ncbi:MAG: hypothetical protein P4L66_06990 [Acetobacteraceae bacterium]|nr:hypothetical protein [Acetobacteraceae bacterium]
MRNALGPAMLVAERLTMHADPAVKRAGQVILDSLDATTALMRQYQANSAQ